MNDYITNFNNYVSTHQLKIGWHKADDYEKHKITESRTRMDESKYDPFVPIINDLMPFIILAVKQEGEKQELSPEQIYHKIGKEVVKTIQDGIKSQGTFTFRGNTTTHTPPPLKPYTIKKKKEEGAPYITQRLMEWGNLVNSIGYSIE